MLSVVIASYNGASYIGRCLESFTIQSIDPDKFEVIVVDNNSTDHTSQIASEYVDQHTNFILLKEEKQGVSYARNLGISNSRGKYICFIDDDAYADTNWLKNILLAFEDENECKSFADMLVRDMGFEYPCVSTTCCVLVVRTHLYSLHLLHVL